MRRLWGELIEVPGLIGDYVEDFGKALQRLTVWLRRWNPDPDLRAAARSSTRPASAGGES